MRKHSYVAVSLIFMVILLNACGGGENDTEKPAANQQEEIQSNTDAQTDINATGDINDKPKIKTADQTAPQNINNDSYAKDQQSLQSALSSQDIETCQSITDESLKTACINNILMTQAFAKQDTTYCDQMIGQSAKNECYKKVQ